MALVGAGQRPRSVGQVVLRNMVSAGFPGPIYPVNPKYQQLEGLACYPDVASLPQAPDLAVLCVGAGQAPGLVSQLGARGTRAAVIITAGFGEVGTPEGKALEAQLLAAAKEYGLRLIGPNCVGLMVPGAGVNASFAHIAPAAGKLAFVSQSGALCTAILDDVAQRGIGFSHFVSLGNSADVDFGDMLDFLANDPNTSAILLYIESVGDVRKFISAGRAASRTKPVIVIKSGRNAAGAKAAASHTGALIGADAVYDVAFRRAGMLRVYDMEELFDSVETLARIAGRPGAFRQPQGPTELTIVSNGGGPAVLATDYLVAGGGKLATLSPEVLEKLNAVLPPTWSHGNPVDIIGDADGARYKGGLDTVMQAAQAEAVLVMKCPTAVSDNLEVAQSVIDVVKGVAEPAPLVLSCWLGAATAGESRTAFAQAGIPTYETPEKAVRAFLHIDRFRQNQRHAMEVASGQGALPADVAGAKAILAKVKGEGRSELFEYEAKALFAAYGIPVVRTEVVCDVAGAKAAAARIGYPVAVKVVSPQISHKTDVGGVVLHIKTPQQLEQAIDSIQKNVERLRPDATLEGFTVQQMAAQGGYELIIGARTDRQFGPVLMFGEGGVAVEVIDDKALGLPPLNRSLALDMIRATRVYKRLKGFRDRKPVDMDGLAQVLMQVSQMVIDLPDVAELDINPLIVQEHSLLALDARVKLGPPSRPAVSTYPQGLEQDLVLGDGRRFRIRPVRPEDGAGLVRLMAQLTPKDLFQRFHGEFPVLLPAQAARISQVDYDREIVLVVSGASDGQYSEIYGCLQCTMHPGSSRGEFTLMVRSDMKGLGLGRALVAQLLKAAPLYPQLRDLVGRGRRDNAAVAELLADFGFMATPDAGGMVTFTKTIG